MDFNELRRKLHALQLPPGSFIVIGGSVLAALGIRPATDLDLTVSVETYDYLQQLPGWKEETWLEKHLLKYDVYDIGGADCSGVPLEEMLADALWIDGVPFMNLDRLTRWKRLLGRPKDLRDIELIAEYRTTRRNAAYQAPHAAQ